MIMLGLIYLTFDRGKVRLLHLFSYAHILGTGFLFFLVLYFNYYNQLVYCGPMDIESLITKPDYNQYIVLSFFMIILLQILFIINIFVAIIKRPKNSNRY